MPVYETADEIRFIRDLRIRNPRLCLQYCRTLINHSRRWDPAIVIGSVRRAARQAIREIRHERCSSL